MGGRKKIRMALAIGFAAMAITFTDARTKLNRIQEAIGKPENYDNEGCEKIFIIHEEGPGYVIFIYIVNRGMEKEHPAKATVPKRIFIL